MELGYRVCCCKSFIATLPTISAISLTHFIVLKALCAYVLVISSATISNVIQCLITRPQSALSHTKKVSNIVAGSSGYVMFSGLSPGVYTLRVVATNRKPDKVFITIRFEITDDPDRCTLHLINEGVSVRGDSVRVEFTGRGPASDYLCSLDKTQPYQCMCLTVLTVALRFGVIWTLSLSYITKHGILGI